LSLNRFVRSILQITLLTLTWNLSLTRIASVVHSGLDEISRWKLSVERVVTSITWDRERHELTTVRFYFTDFAQFATYAAHCSTFLIMLIPTKKIKQFQRNHTEVGSNSNISKAALRQKSCDFNHLKSGTSRTYNSPLLFYRFRSIHDVHSTTLKLFNFVDPNKKDWMIPKKPNKNDCNPPFTQWHNQGCSCL